MKRYDVYILTPLLAVPAIKAESPEEAERIVQVTVIPNLIAAGVLVVEEMYVLKAEGTIIEDIEEDETDAE